MSFNKKRVTGLALLTIVIAGLLIGFVSAQTSGAGAFQPIADIFVNIFNVIVQALKPVLELLLGEVPSGADNSMFIKQVLIAIVVFAVVYAVSKNIPIFSDSTHTWVRVVVALAFAVGGARFMSKALINNAFIPTEALGMALFAIIPFIAWFFLVKDFSSGFLRRTSWVLFSVAIFAVWSFAVNKGDDLGAAGSLSRVIYPLTAIIALIMAIADSTIQSAFAKIKAENMATAGHSKHYIKLSKELEDVDGLTIRTPADKVVALARYSQIIADAGRVDTKEFKELKARTELAWRQLNNRRLP